MKKHDDGDVYEFLLSEGDNYLPDEIIDGGLLVESYAEVEDINYEDFKITGSCLIECRDEGEEMDVAFKARFLIELDEDENVEKIEFTNLRVE